MSPRRDIARAIRGGGWAELTPGQQRPYFRAATRVIAAIEQDKRMSEKSKRLVEDWRNCWRWWSVRLNAVGLIILGWISFDPVGVLYVWSLMPDAVTALLPPRILMFVGLGLFALSMIARVVKQKPVGE